MNKKIYLGMALILLFISINQLFVKAGLSDKLFSVIVYPFLILQNKISTPIKSLLSNFSFSNDLKDLVSYYRRENENLQAQLIEYYGLKTYAQSVKELNDFLSKYKCTTSIIAQVILKNFDENQHFILLDAGFNRGVQEDMVVVYKNCLIGKVCQVYKYYSRVILITDKSCKVSAYCVSNNVQGIHVGQNNLTETKLTFVNHLDTVNNSDLILSSGEGIIFPRGFGLGYVKDAYKEDFNYHITVKPMVDFTTIEYCTIIQKGAELNEQQDTSNNFTKSLAEQNVIEKQSEFSNDKVEEQENKIELPNILNNQEQSVQLEKNIQPKKIIKKKVIRKISRIKQ